MCTEDRRLSLHEYYEGARYECMDMDEAMAVDNPYQAPVEGRSSVVR